MRHKTSPSNGPSSPEVVGFYEDATGSVQYVVIDPNTRRAALIDVVQDFAPANARASTDSADEILEFVRRRDLQVEWILDTHPHADHLMASSYLHAQLGAPTAIGEKVRDVAELWRGYYNTPDAIAPEQDFSRLLRDGDMLSVGELPVLAFLSPGHTLASMTYVVGSDAAFVHDTFMHVDFGTARADFPGGSSRALYRSLQRILELPDDTRLFVGHDYGTDERKEPAWEATVAQHRASNVHIGGGVAEEAFVKLRDERDKTLALPDRMLMALQINLRGGRPPAPEDDGHSYLRVPLNRF